MENIINKEKENKSEKYNYLNKKQVKSEKNKNKR